MVIVITYTNGSTSKHPFKHFQAARDFYQNNISYSGDRVRRVELGGRAIWDISWDDYSKAVGLRS